MFGRVVVFPGDENALCIPFRRSSMDGFKRRRYCEVCVWQRRRSKLALGVLQRWVGTTRTLEEVFVNDTPVWLGNKHAELRRVLGVESCQSGSTSKQECVKLDNTAYCETWFALTLGWEEGGSARSSEVAPGHPPPENVSMTYRFSRKG